MMTVARPAVFSLRLYEASEDRLHHSNVQVGLFTPSVGMPGQCHTFDTTEQGVLDQVDFSRAALQIYPAQAAKHTFYQVDCPPNAIHVFCECKGGRDGAETEWVYRGATTARDDYLYFKPPPLASVMRIAVVIAETRERARNTLYLGLSPQSS